MSRRTRIKMGGRSREKFTLAHHSQYASTTTYFPRAYSYLGNDITFPISVLPLFSGNKITYAGSSTKFFEKLDETTFSEEEIKLASISFQGQKYQDSTPLINLIALVLTMVCFCLYWMLETTFYRDGHFPKYNFSDYETIIKVVERFKNVQTLIINFQDNDLDPTKMARLDEAFSQSNSKTIVFRNLTYFMRNHNFDEYFPKTRAKSSIDFKFIWEKYVLLSPNRHLGDEESKPLGFCDEI